MSNNFHPLILTDDEIYILACVMGHVRHNDNKSVNSLLQKIYQVSDHFNITCEDYEKVVFTDGNKSVLEDITVDFQGTNRSEDLEALIPKEEELIAKELSPMEQLSKALSAAISTNDLGAVFTYASAIQRLSNI